MPKSGAYAILESNAVGRGDFELGHTHMKSDMDSHRSAHRAATLRMGPTPIGRVGCRKYIPTPADGSAAISRCGRRYAVVVGSSKRRDSVARPDASL